MRRKKLVDFVLLGKEEKEVGEMLITLLRYVYQYAPAVANITKYAPAFLIHHALYSFLFFHADRY